MCIVYEVMEAYQSCCAVVPKHMEDGGMVELATSLEDAKNWVIWFNEYSNSTNNKWWKFMVDDIISLLQPLPLTREALQEVEEFVRSACHYAAPMS